MRYQSLAFALSTLVGTGLGAVGCVVVNDDSDETLGDTDFTSSTTRADTSGSPTTDPTTTTDPDTTAGPTTTDTDPTGLPTGSETETTAVPTGPSHDADIQPIWDASCALAGCHGTPAGSGPSLIAGEAYAALVGPTSPIAGQAFVVPGDPASSYLITKLRGGEGLIGLVMPQTGGPLPEEQIALIEEWIATGAAP